MSKYKELLIELKRLKKDIASCKIKEVMPLIQPANISLKGREKEHLLEHVENVEKMIKEFVDVMLVEPQLIEMTKRVLSKEVKTSREERERFKFLKDMWED